jgi:hypothetical protein
VEPRMTIPPSNKGNVHFEIGLATRTSSGLIWIDRPWECHHGQWRMSIFRGENAQRKRFFGRCTVSGGYTRVDPQRASRECGAL